MINNLFNNIIQQLSTYNVSFTLKQYLIQGCSSFKNKT